MKEFEIKLVDIEEITVQAESKAEAWVKAFEEFMKIGINPHCFRHRYIDGEEI